MTTDNFFVICKTGQSKPVKQEANSTVILPLLVFPDVRESAVNRVLDGSTYPG